MKRQICVFLLSCISFFSGCKPAVSSQIEYEKTFEDKKDDNYELNVLPKSDLDQYRFYLLLTGGLLFGSICFYLYKGKKRDAEIVKLEAERQILDIQTWNLCRKIYRKKSN